MSSAVCNLTQIFKYPNIPLVISFCERKSTYLWYFGKYLYRNADCCNSCHLRHSSSSFSQFKRQKLQRYFTQTKLVQEFNNRDSSYLIASRDCTRRKSSEYFRLTFFVSHLIWFAEFFWRWTFVICGTWCVCVQNVEDRRRIGPDYGSGFI